MCHSWGNGHKLLEGLGLNLLRKDHGRGPVLEGSLPVGEYKDWAGCQRDLAGHSLVDRP